MRTLREPASAGFSRLMASVSQAVSNCLRARSGSVGGAGPFGAEVETAPGGEDEREGCGERGDASVGQEPNRPASAGSLVLGHYDAKVGHHLILVELL